ncbi:hypothetical protein WDU94_007883 [Cyamophila willieti]
MSSRKKFRSSRNTYQFNEKSKKSHRFFENYTRQGYGTKNMMASSFILSELDVVQEAVSYVKDKDYFKDHFRMMCIKSPPQGVTPSKNTSKSKKWACVCQKSSHTPLRQYVKKSAIDTKTVISAVDSMLLDVFTKCPELLGCEKNGLQFRRNVCHVLRFTKNQFINTSLLTRKLKMKSVPWLNEFPEMQERTRLFSEFCLGMFHMTQIVVLKHFYIAVNRLSQPVFYMKPHWHGLVHLHENQLKSEKLKPALIPIKGARKIRWIPKGCTCLLRPIFLHRTEKGEKRNFESLNFVLRTILNHPYFSDSRTTTRPSKDFRMKWKLFHREWAKVKPAKMYVVQSDLKDAFGCIEHAKLVEIVTKWVKKMFSYPTLTLYRSYNRKKRTSVYWFPEIPGQTSPNLEIERDFCTPQLVKTHTQPSLIYWIQRTLRQLFASQVKIGKKNFEYATGILQGHPLSSNLCEIYYGDICNSYHSEFKSQTTQPTFVLNAMDDMILITSDENMALRYLNFIRDETQCPVQINLSKLTSNLCPLGKDCKAGPAGPHNKKIFSFCGVNIHSVNLNLSGSYVNYDDKNMFHSFTFREESYIRVIKNKLSFFLSLKAHPLFLDREYNSRFTIVRNIFELGVHQSCRFNSLVINLCIQNYGSELKDILVTSLINLRDHLSKRLRWRKDTKNDHILFILVEAMRLISLKYNSHYGLNRPDLIQCLVSLRPTVEDRELNKWIESLKKTSLVPRMLMGGV